MHNRFVTRAVAVTAIAMMPALPAAAQMEPQHQHTQMQGTPGGWTFMQDGVVFGLFNHQGGSRGGNELVVPNWWMGMATRPVRSSRLTLNAMFSLDAATVGRSGYREIFQVGEALDNRPLVDRQHPHDFFMQLAASWRTPLSGTTGLTIAGGPVGEPALGPVAFMHRASAFENPFAPLSHHTFDSTHIAFGVITAAVDRGPWTVEASVFNGREPDDNRWDFDFGRLDSVSARVWFKPRDAWEFQVSTGHLVDPEELWPEHVQRTTASVSWFVRSDEDFSAVTAGYGMNATEHGHRQSLFAEATRRAGPNTLFGRAELAQVEADVLLSGIPASHDGAARNGTVGAYTVGAVRDVVTLRGFEGGIGAQATFYAVPDELKPTHGSRPVSFQLFFRLRPPAGPMGRMFNARMVATP